MEHEILGKYKSGDYFIYIRPFEFHFFFSLKNYIFKTWKNSVSASSSYFPLRCLNLAVVKTKWWNVSFPYSNSTIFQEHISFFTTYSKHSVNSNFMFTVSKAFRDGLLPFLRILLRIRMGLFGFEWVYLDSICF